MRKSTICVVAAAAFLQSCTSITFRKVNESEMNDLANFPNNPVASKKSTYLKKDLPVDPQNHITAVGSFREGFFQCKFLDDKLKRRNKLAIVIENYNNLFENGTEFSCTEASVYQYGIGSDQGTEPYFLTMKNTAQFAGHMAFPYKYRGKFGATGGNISDQVLPVLDSFADVVQIINLQNITNDKTSIQYTSFKLVKTTIPLIHQPKKSYILHPNNMFDFDTVTSTITLGTYERKVSEFKKLEQSKGNYFLPHTDYELRELMRLNRPK